MTEAQGDPAVCPRDTTARQELGVEVVCLEYWCLRWQGVLLPTTSRTMETPPHLIVRLPPGSLHEGACRSPVADSGTCGQLPVQSWGCSELPHPGV